MWKDDNDYVKCKTTGRNTKLNPNTSLGTCMLQMRKNDYASHWLWRYSDDRKSAKPVTSWRLLSSEKCRRAGLSAAANVSVERAAAILKYSKASVHTDQLKRCYTPKCRNLQSNRRGNLRSRPRDNFYFIFFFFSGQMIPLSTEVSFTVWNQALKRMNGSHKIQTFLAFHWTLYIYLYDQIRYHANR
jgi:hypothetical protein